MLFIGGENGVVTFQPASAGDPIPFQPHANPVIPNNVVAMTFNSDVGDSWEWADSPEYPERFASLGMRIGVNYVVYAMTH